MLSETLDQDEKVVFSDEKIVFSLNSECIIKDLKSECLDCKIITTNEK